MLHHDSQLHTIRLNDYNTLFHFDIESHADFEPLVSKIINSTIKIYVGCVFFEHTGWSIFS
jgi:hypothetical protein